MPAFVTAADVRGYMAITASTGQWSDASLGSNISAASAFLQRKTMRQFEPVTETRTFTTNGVTYLTLPDLRSVTSVSLAGQALTANTDYYLIPDRFSPTIYTGIQFRPFGQRNPQAAGWWQGNSQWFDRGYDLVNRTWADDENSLPNDLVIAAAWGWVPYPDELLHPTKVLSAFYAKRTDAVLGDKEITVEGHERSFRMLPLEVQEFCYQWKLGEMAISVG